MVHVHVPSNHNAYLYVCGKNSEKSVAEPEAELPFHWIKNEDLRARYEEASLKYPHVKRMEEMEEERKLRKIKMAIR